MPSDPALRTKSLELLLVEKGLVDPAALDAVVDAYEHKVGPRNGARVIARAWTDAAFKQRLLADGAAALKELGYGGAQGEDTLVVENTPRVHNLVVCTLCSCYPWPLLGLPPVWYKSAPYRSRAVIDPRGVLAEFGVTVADDVEVRVWDSHRGTALSRAAGAAARQRAVERRSIGRAGHSRRHDRRCKSRAATERSPAMNGVHDMGGDQGMGPIQYEKDEPVFHAPWEGRVYAINRLLGAWRKWTIDGSRHGIELLPPADYFRMSYYERWLVRTDRYLDQDRSRRRARRSRAASPPRDRPRRRRR